MGGKDKTLPDMKGSVPIREFLMTSTVQYVRLIASNHKGELQMVSLTKVMSKHESQFFDHSCCDIQQHSKTSLSLNLSVFCSLFNAFVCFSLIAVVYLRVLPPVCARNCLRLWERPLNLHMGDVTGATPIIFQVTWFYVTS